MNVRVPFEWLMATSLFAGHLAIAQDWQGTPSGPYGAQAQYASAEVMEGEYAAPSAGYYQPDIYYSEPPADMYQELLPVDRGFRYSTDSRFQLNFRQRMRGTWGRLEYMQGNISHEGGGALGAPYLRPAAPLTNTPAEVIADPSQQFEVYLPNPAYIPGSTTIPPYLTRGAQAATTSGIRWKNAQGMRGSFGIPITDAVEVEGRFWGFEEQDNTLTYPLFPTATVQGAHGTLNNTFMLTPLTTDGVVSSTAIIYDAGFNANYTSQLKAGDVALVFNWINPEEGWRFQPLLGYRHEEYTENLSFGGTFDNRSNYLTGRGIITAQSNNITSNVQNMRDMAEIGMRLEWQKKFVTLGIQERFALGTNIAQAGVSTINLREPGTVPGTYTDSPLTASHQRRVTFVPTSDLDAYINVRMTRWFTFRVGYNLIWMGGVAAADESIRYNQVSDGAGGTTPDVATHIRSSSRTVSSLTIGGEIAFP